MENTVRREGNENPTDQSADRSDGCIIRLCLDTIPYDTYTSRKGIREDYWFGSINTANENGLRGHEGLKITQHHSFSQREY
jgi:hypothetical protein